MTELTYPVNINLTINGVYRIPIYINQQLEKVTSLKLINIIYEHLGFRIKDICKLTYNGINIHVTNGYWPFFPKRGELNYWNDIIATTQMRIMPFCRIVDNCLKKHTIDQELFIKQVTLWLILGFDIDEHDYTQKTALMLSIYSNNGFMTNTLLKYGANINVKDRNGCTVLCHTMIQKNIDAMRDFIKKGLFLNKDHRHSWSLRAERGGIVIGNINIFVDYIMYETYVKIKKECSENYI